MSADPVDRFRDELRHAASKRAATWRRRHRASVALAIAASALFIVGGAIAAKQNHWLSADSGAVQLEMRVANHQRLDSLMHGYKSCLAKLGVGSAERCAPYFAAITATCLIPRGVRNRVSAAAASRCTVVLIRRLGASGAPESATASSTP